MNLHNNHDPFPLAFGGLFHPESLAKISQIMILSDSASWVALIAALIDMKGSSLPLEYYFYLMIGCHDIHIRI